MRCFNSVAEFCLEIENCHLITSQGCWEWAVAGIGLSCLSEVPWEQASASGPVLCGVVRSWYEVGTNTCKILVAPCQNSAGDPVYDSMPDRRFRRKHGHFSDRSCTASKLHHRTYTFPLQPLPALYINWCKPQCEVSPNCLVSLGP